MAVKGPSTTHMQQVMRAVESGRQGKGSGRDSSSPQGPTTAESQQTLGSNSKSKTGVVSLT